MVSRGAFWGVVAVLFAALLLMSTLAIYYYSQYQGQTSQNQTQAEELNAALASYSALASRYNASLGDYNSTLSLLALAVGNLNTSSPAYRAASHDLSSLWESYQILVKQGGANSVLYSVHFLLDYGNGTRRWYNDTAAQPGWNGYVATLVILNGRVQAIWYPPGYFVPGGPGEHFVTGINGVNQTASTSWFFWGYAGSRWSVAPSGADLVQINNGTTVAWTLCSYDSNYNPTCTP
jgi:hypothetical protein